MERNGRDWVGRSDMKHPMAPVWVRALSTRQQGVALAIVVWFIAGMSLLVAGIVAHARVDTKMAQLHVARAKAAAVGDGAIQLMLAERLLQVDPTTAGAGASAGHYRLGNTEVSVSLYPVSGFVNLGSAPREVLATLFRMAGRVPEGEANFLADNVVKWRGGLLGPDNTKAHAGQFKVIEDLLRVEGVSRTLLDAVRDFVVAGGSGGAATDWAVAPEALLQVLKNTNPGELDKVLRRRENLAAAQEAGGGEQTEAPPMSGDYRVDALVRYGDQAWLRRRWVSMGASPGSELPWRVLRTEPPRVYKR